MLIHVIAANGNGVIVNTDHVKRFEVEIDPSVGTNTRIRFTSNKGEQDQLLVKDMLSDIMESMRSGGLLVQLPKPLKPSRRKAV